MKKKKRLSSRVLELIPIDAEMVMSLTQPLSLRCSVYLSSGHIMWLLHKQSTQSLWCSTFTSPSVVTVSCVLPQSVSHLP